MVYSVRKKTTNSKAKPFDLLIYLTLSLCFAIVGYRALFIPMTERPKKIYQNLLIKENGLEKVNDNKILN